MTAAPDTFYFTLGSCSLASLAALEEAGHAYAPRKLAMGLDGAGDEAYAAISPLRQVPALATATGVIRETGAILTWLDTRHPGARLLPSDAAQRVAALRWIGFLGGTLQPTFRLVWRPARWVGADEPAQAALRTHAGAYLRRVIEVAAAELAGPWALAERSAVDFYLHVFTRWMALSGIPAPEALQRHHLAVAALPSMQRAVAIESSEPEAT